MAKMESSGDRVEAGRRTDVKRKELLVVNVTIAILVLFFGLLTVRLSINEGLFSAVVHAFAGKPAINKDISTGCDSKKPLQLSGYTDSHLSQLQRYQHLCGSFVTNNLMIFTSFPASTTTAQSDAKAMAAKLHLLHKAGITPLVVAEPYVGDGAMSYKAFLAGDYDQALRTYFTTLKNEGITDAMMGTWVPFPESNTPNWNNKETEPRDFALCVNKYLSAMKTVFPKAKGSILLSAVTYEPDDLAWENGDYLSLIPYLQDIDRI
jgi:hypothetical protein